MSQGLFKKEDPSWKLRVSLILGIALIAVVIVLDTATYFEDFGGEYTRFLFAAGGGLIFFGLGSRAAGKWGSIVIAGGAAGLSLVFYSMLYVSRSEPCECENVMIAKIRGFGNEVRTVEAKAEARNEARLYGYYQRNKNSFNSSEFKIRIEESDLITGCIQFQVVPLAINDELNRFFVHTANLKSLREDHQIPWNEQIEFEYEFSVDNINGVDYPNDSMAYTNGGKIIQVSNPGYEGCSRTPKNETATFYQSFFVMKAFAENQITPHSIEPLITSIRSDDSLRRFEAEQILINYPPNDVIPIILDDLKNPDRTSDEKELISAELVRIVEGMLNRSVGPDQIRNLFKNEAELKPLVQMLSYPNITFSYSAMSSLLRLSDQRVNKYLVDILKGNEKNGKSFAAFVLSSNFSTLTDDDKSKLSEEINAITGDLDEGIAQLLSVVTKYSDTNERMLNGKSDPIGWVYVGIKNDNDWAEKNFVWNSNFDLPQKDDTLTATGLVNIRKDYIKFNENTGRWTNAEILGLVQRGDKVKVINTKNVANGFHWVEIARDNF